MVEILSQMIGEMQSTNSQQSVVTEWSVLEAKLEKLGLPKEVIEEEFFFISDWLKENSLEQVEEDAEDAEDVADVEAIEDEELPDYAPGEQRNPIEEKVQVLDEMARNVATDEPVATSSKAEPPPYTFEEGTDEPIIDSEFSHFIQTAIATDADIRVLKRKLHPELGPHPTSWLPKSVQAQFEDSRDIIPIMPADSFTAMAYETAPRCVDEIERLKRLLRTSSAFKQNMHSGVGKILAFYYNEHVITPLPQHSKPRTSSSNTQTLSRIQILFDLELIPRSWQPMKRYKLWK